MEVKVKKIYLVIGVLLLINLFIWGGLFLSRRQAKPTTKPSPATQAELKQFLPHGEFDFAIDYIPETQKYRVTLFASTSRALFTDEEIKANLKKQKTEALNWIKSKGLDPTKLNLEFVPPEATSL